MADRLMRTDSQSPARGTPRPRGQRCYSRALRRGTQGAGR